MKNKRRLIYLTYSLLGFISSFTIVTVSNAVARSLDNATVGRPPTIRKEAVPVPLPVPTPAKKRQESQYLQKRSWTGKVSHYSRSGCLGCSPSLTMANGQPLDDNALTIAFNYLPLGSMVKLTNIDTGKSVIAEVTDTGGFNSLGRIADLTPKVASALESKTDVSNILIEEL